MAAGSRDGTREPDETLPPLPTPHDRFFQALLSDSRRAGAFLRDHLPNDIAGLLDQTILPVALEGRFVDEALSRSQSDLLFRVTLKSGKEAFVYTLLEHKSYADPGLPLQLASYMIRIWKRHAGTDAAKLRALPPIIPIVLFHGESEGMVPASLAAAVDTEGQPALAFAEGFSYIFRNIRRLTTEELSRDADLKAGLIVLKRDAIEFLDTVLLGLQSDPDLYHQVLEYILHVYSVPDLEWLSTVLENKLGYPEVTLNTIAETLIAQGKAQGKAEGRAEGRAEGEAKGQAEGEAKMLARLLERRFGPLPRSARERIAAAAIEQLDRWGDGVLEAQSLDDLLGQPEASS